MRKTGVLFAMIVLWLSSQGQQYPFVYYTPKDGLVNSRVWRIYQDSKGRLYFMTYGGLSIYDGARFKNFTAQSGLAADMVNDVVEAGEDSLLVATNNTQLNMLVQGKIKTFPSANQTSPIINHFLKSSDGNIYATADEGLYKIIQHSFEQLPLAMAPVNIPPYLGNILELNNYFLLNTNDLRGFRGLYLYDRIKKQLIDSMTKISVSGFERDRSGQIWITVNDSIALLDTISLRKGKLRLQSLPPAFKAAARFPSISFGFDGSHVWTIHEGKELIRTGQDGSQVRLIPNKDGQSGIERVFIDRENIIWICSNDFGVLKMVNTTLQINTPPPINNLDGILYYCYSVQDTAWFRDNSKIARQTSGMTETFTTNLNSPAYSIFQTGPDLFATTLNRLYHAVIPQKGVSKIQFKLVESLSGLDGYRGLAIRDPYGHLIFAERETLAIYDNMKLVAKYLVTPGDFIENLSIDKSNRIWVTCRGSGITIYTIHPDDPGNYLKPVYQFQKELNGASPRSMTLDKRGIAWVGTRSHGLMAFTFEKDQLKLLLHLQRRQGLTDDFITSLACDSSNNILVGSQTGLDRIILNNRNEYKIENITKRNNTFGYIVNIWVDDKGQASAILRNGAILKIAPVQHTSNAFEPSLFIEEMKVNGTIVQPGTSMELPYTQRNLTINMAAPSFVDEHQVQYSYQLQGSGNNEWSEASSNPDFNFLNLSPGKYKLNVKASFPSTDYPPSYLSYSFSIIPPWWKTLWFRILAGVLIIVLVTMAIRVYYRRKLEKQMVLLEKQQAVEKERTRIATDMHDDLGAGLSKIKFLSETIGIKKQQHQPIEEDIGKIREYAHDMIDKMGEIVWALNQKNDSVSDLLSYTRAYAAEYLAQNGIQCSFHAPELFSGQFVSGEFRRNIYLTVKEALHNVVKHSQASQVSITMSTETDLHITIHDNGCGFNEKKIRPFSNGLGNMKKRMESMGGSCRIIHDNGTIVMIDVPL